MYWFGVICLALAAVINTVVSHALSQGYCDYEVSILGAFLGLMAALIAVAIRKPRSHKSQWGRLAILLLGIAMVLWGFNNYYWSMDNYDSAWGKGVQVQARQ